MISRIGHYLRKLRPELARWGAGYEPTFWVTADGVVLTGGRIEAESDPDADLSYVVVHGLLGSHASPGFKSFAESLARYGTTLMMDLRGHGGSGGECTLGDKEAIDVAAVLSDLDPAKTVLIGFSMGAAAVVRAAALYETPLAVVAVSGPAAWDGPRRWGAIRTSLLWRVPGATRVLRAVTGVRLNPGFEGCESPSDVVHKVAPAPVLVVHGTHDDFFPPSEAEDLYAAAGEPKQMWMIEDGGHAEGLFSSGPGYQAIMDLDEFVDGLVLRLKELLDWQR